MGKRKELRHGTQYSYGKLGCRCEPCTKANTDGIRQRKQKKRALQPRLPVEPLVKHMPKEFSERHQQAIKAWEKKGLTVYEADRICTQYGVHPFYVYGTRWINDLWTEATEAKSVRD